MPTTSRGPESSSPEQFQTALYKGGELLSLGQTQEAREQLETAYALAPENEKARSLLGLTYFKLGLVEQALSIYLALVEQNPTDATLRVNLGLVYLKSGEHERAVEQLTLATTLDPLHPKAQQYLNLAKAQAPQSPIVAATIDDGSIEVMSEESFPTYEGAVVETVDAELPPMQYGQQEDDWNTLLQDDSATPAPAPTPPASPMAAAVSPFQLGPEGMAVSIAGELAMRLEGLLAVVGSVQVRPMHRRQQGLKMNEILGGGPSPLQQLVGQGVVYVEPGTHNFEEFDWTWHSPMRWGEAEPYLREDAVFAFESALSFENGRLTDENRALEMIRFTGAGRVLLQLEGALRVIPLPADAPMVVLEERLIGWVGWVTPRMLLLGGRNAIELAGEGVAILRVPAART